MSDFCLPAHAPRIFRPSVIIVLLMLIMHGVLLFNAVFHDPEIVYDARGHLDYVETLAQGRLPAREENCEFFSPPLPYVLPALCLRLTHCALRFAQKLAQLQNVVWSLILCWGLTRLSKRVRPDDDWIPVWAVFFVAIAPVYYKSFAFVRGEPMLAMLVVLLLLQVLVTLESGCRSWRHTLTLGFLIGTGALARQWAFLAFAGLTIFAALCFWRARSCARRDLLVTMMTAMVMGLLFSGWFYLHLNDNDEGFTAFNRAGKSSLRLANQPREFYFGMGEGYLFADPVREHFNNQFVPTFYSEFWGDYEAYFLFCATKTTGSRFVSPWNFARLTEKGEVANNRETMGPYLGRVNLSGLLPTACYGAGVVMLVIAALRLVVSAEVRSEDWARALIALVILTSLGGYFVFVMLFPHPSGNTIKATYLLHALPLLAIGAALFVRLVMRRWRKVGGLLAVLLVATYLHAGGAYVTRYVTVPWGAGGITESATTGHLN